MHATPVNLTARKKLNRQEGAIVRVLMRSIPSILCVNQMTFVPYHLTPINAYQHSYEDKNQFPPPQHILHTLAYQSGSLTFASSNRA